MDEDREFCPDWYIPPGATITAFLEEKKLTLEWFSDQMGFSMDFTKNLIEGVEILTPEIAEKLAVVVGATAKFWLRREEQYRLDKARIEGQRCLLKP